LMASWWEIDARPSDAIAVASLATRRLQSTFNEDVLTTCWGNSSKAGSDAAMRYQRHNCRLAV